MQATLSFQTHILELDDRRFKVAADLCGKDSCAHRHTLITELTPQSEPLKDGLFLKLNLPITARKLPDPNTFEGRLVDLLKSPWRADRLLTPIEVNAEFLATRRLSKRERRESTLQSYIDLVDPSGSFLNDGEKADFRFSWKDRSFVVLELYCSDPRCFCDEACLLFAEEGAESDDVQHLDDRFLASISLDGQLKEIDDETDESDAIFQAFHRIYGEDLAHCAERLQVVKEVGKRSQKRTLSTQKRPAKNALCPCGSNKKYKGCCGRSATQQA